MILVTGAGGKSGRAVVQTLAQRGAKVRAFVRTPEQADMLGALGAAEAVAGDLAAADDVKRACANVEAIYHICPNMREDEIAIAMRVIDGALSSQTPRLVYHSVLHPQTEEMPHHWRKLRVEELLFKSRLEITILQPAVYMQNVLAGWGAISGEGVYRTPYRPETRLSMVDLEDVAAAAATVLLEAGHADAIYELVGPDALTQHQVAAVLAQEMDRPVTAQMVARSVWQRGAEQSGLDAYAVESLRKMFIYYEQFGLRGNPRGLQMLLGRAPTSFAEFVRRHLQRQAQV